MSQGYPVFFLSHNSIVLNVTCEGAPPVLHIAYIQGEKFIPREECSGDMYEHVIVGRDMKAVDGSHGLFRYTVITNGCTNVKYMKRIITDFKIDGEVIHACLCVREKETGKELYKIEYPGLLVQRFQDIRTLLADAHNMGGVGIDIDSIDASKHELCIEARFDSSDYNGHLPVLTMLIALNACYQRTIG